MSQWRWLRITIFSSRKLPAVQKLKLHSHIYDLMMHGISIQGLRNQGSQGSSSSSICLDFWIHYIKFWKLTVLGICIFYELPLDKNCSGSPVSIKNIATNKPRSITDLLCYTYFQEIASCTKNKVTLTFLWFNDAWNSYMKFGIFPGCVLGCFQGGSRGWWLFFLL